MYKLAIFDLDGTILDTLDDLFYSVNFSLNKNGLPERTKEEVRSFVGNGIRLLIDRAVPDGTDPAITDKVFTDFKLHYSEHSLDNTKPYDGINETILKIRKQGIKTAVVSNKADFAVQKLVSTFFDGIFDFILGETEGIRKKPAPDMIIKTLDYFSISATDCIYIGDSEVDIETARNSGIDLFCVDWGFRDRDILIKNGGEIIFSEVSELYDYLTQ